MNELIQTALDALLQHVPTGQAWMPHVGAALAALFGLLLMIRGARMAPLLAALVIGGGAGVGGAFLANGVALPVWPTIAAAGVVGFVLGLVLFRLWLALLIGVCFAGAGLSVYGFQVLQPHLASYLSQGQAENGDATLPPPGSALSQQGTAAQELAKIWAHLSAKVPYFVPSFATITAVTLIAGFVFGLLLPTASRSLWAATTGTVLVGCGATALLQAFAPAVLQWLMQNNALSWSAVGVAWLGSLVYNALTCGRKRRATVIDDSAGPAPAAA